MNERLNSNELDGGKYLVLHEFVKAAKQKLNANIWDYLIGGTETETTLARNRMAIDTVALRPRVLNDVSRVDTGVDFFGHRIRLPVFLAPVGSLESFEPGGGVVSVTYARLHRRRVGHHSSGWQRGRGRAVGRCRVRGRRGHRTCVVEERVPDEGAHQAGTQAHSGTQWHPLETPRGAISGAI
jgi:hypothetical protein